MDVQASISTEAEAEAGSPRDEEETRIPEEASRRAIENNNTSREVGAADTAAIPESRNEESADDTRAPLEEFHHVAKKRKIEGNPPKVTLENEENAVKTQYANSESEEESRRKISDENEDTSRGGTSNPDSISFRLTSDRSEVEEEQQHVNEESCTKTSEDIDTCPKEENLTNDDSSVGKPADDMQTTVRLPKDELTELENCTDQSSEDILQTCDKSVNNDVKRTESYDNSETNIQGSENIADNENSNSVSVNLPENGSDKYQNYEKSVPNDDIIKHVLQNSLCSTWQKISLNPCSLTLVDVSSTEFEHINALFSPTSRGLKIKRLERIENPYLLAQYLLKKEEKRKDHSVIEEKKLFHGTRERNIEGISKFNFDWRLRGSSRGHKFGQGVSFTPEVSYAQHYTHGDKVIVLSKVLVGNSTIGDYDTVVPPGFYDTTRNRQGTVFVKYEDNEFLPRYVIHFD